MRATKFLKMSCELFDYHSGLILNELSPAAEGALDGIVSARAQTNQNAVNVIAGIAIGIFLRLYGRVMMKYSPRFLEIHALTFSVSVRAHNSQSYFIVLSIKPDFECLLLKSSHSIV